MFSFRHASLSLISLALLSGCTNPTPEDPFLLEIQAQADSLLAQSDLDALSIGLIEKGEVNIIHRGKLLNGSRPDDTSLYEIASLTKTFTGTLLASAISEELVSIDDDIRQYLEGDFPNLKYEDQPITFRHLATHTSGIPRMFPDQPGLFENADFDKLPFEINGFQEGYSKNEFMAALREVVLDTIPGINLAYSNAGANLTGYLLENIYAKPYQELLSEKILTPATMRHTSIVYDEIDQENLVIGQSANKVPMPVRAQKEMNAEGGIFSSTEDMVKYMQFHLDQQNVIALLSQQPLWDGRYGDYEAGIFWQIFKDGQNPDRIFQNGGAYGTSSWMTLIPDTQTGIFVVTNLSGPTVHQLLSELVDNILAIPHGGGNK